MAKIIRKYIFTAVLIAVVVLVMNSSVLIFLGSQVSKDDKTAGLTRDQMEAVTQELKYDDGTYVMSEQGYEILENASFVWAMLIDPNGRAVWSWRLPEEIPEYYTVADISVLSKWYLKDYPVRTWKYGDGIMVYGCDKDSIMRINGTYSLRFLDSVPYNAVWVIVINLSLILVLALLFGYRFFRALKPITDGIESLSRKENISLAEKGIADGLAKKLNQTSRILEEQNKQLAKRDNARTNWISGVSHDIRTPLSLIMGYADALVRDHTMGEEQKKKAASIQRQSLMIKKLIDDLNLTSKLEYDAQPLRLQRYSPSELLREIVTSYYNDGLSDNYFIELDVRREVESVMLNGDTALLNRGFQNLIGNSIRHNPGGCSIHIEMRLCSQGVEILFKDTGIGIPAAVIKTLYTQKPDPEKHPHVMGLRVVKQIIAAHNGLMEFIRKPSGNYDVSIILPERL
nr:HAMP domain-containing sensor histidine kinase [Ruminococcus sp. OA3]